MGFSVRLVSFFMGKDDSLKKWEKRDGGFRFKAYGVPFQRSFVFFPLSSSYAVFFYLCVRYKKIYGSKILGFLLYKKREKKERE